MGRWRPGFKCVKARQWRAFLVLREVSPRKPECLAGDAVGFEPISNATSLLTGNLTGNFTFLVPRRPISLHETPVLQAFPEQFPTQANRENILRNREFLAGKQRILAHEALVRTHHNPGRTSSRIDADERLLCARSDRSDLTCHWIRRARFRRRPGRNCIPTRRDKRYPPIAFQPDQAYGIYRETQESRYALAVFKSAVSKPSLKRSYTDCRWLRASAMRP